MIFDALFLAFTLGSENAKEQTAAMEAKRIMQDENAQRNRFFAEQRKWQEDKFTLFGKVGNSDGYDFQWREALEKITLLDEGYFPFALTLELPISNTVLEKRKLKGFQYKSIPTANGKYTDLYLKLSDVENYIVHRNRSGNHYKRSMYEEIPQEVRELFYAGNTTIGIPFGQVSSVACQAMTIQQARNFMQTVMEKRFQEWFARLNK